MNGQPINMEVLARVAPGNSPGAGYRGRPEPVRLVMRVRWSPLGPARWVLLALAWLFIVPATRWLWLTYEQAESLHMLLGAGMLPLCGVWLLTQTVNHTRITLDEKGVGTWHGPLCIPLLNEVSRAFVPLHDLVGFELQRQQRLQQRAVVDVFCVVARHRGGRTTMLTECERDPYNHQWLAGYLQEYFEHVLAGRVAPSGGP